MTARALVVVDLQQDFCEGGSLPVAGASAVAVRIANAVRYFTSESPYFDYVVATKDWHIPGDNNQHHFSDTPDYVSTWPVHCTQGSDGAKWHPAFVEVADVVDAVFYKGQGVPAYSGFQGVTTTRFGDQYLTDWLYERGVTELTIVGVATDYCVKATALDAIQLGYKVRIPLNLTVAVGGDEAKVSTIRNIYELQGLAGAIIN